MRKTFKELLQEMKWADGTNRDGIDSYNDAAEFYEFVVKTLLEDTKQAPDKEKWSQRILPNGTLETFVNGLMGTQTKIYRYGVRSKPILQDLHTYAFILLQLVCIIYERIMLEKAKKSVKFELFSPSLAKKRVF